MKQYIIVGVLALFLVLLIVGTTLLTLNEFTLGKTQILSIQGMKSKENDLDLKVKELDSIVVQYDSTKSRLETNKASYIAAKNEYSNITEQQLETIKEETKEQRYNLDWLWIVIGEYAEENDLTLHIIDSRNVGGYSNKGTLQIKVVGRYLNISDFVFEIENDNDLMFKLDNMSMEYTSDNKIAATFDVLSMGVVF